MDDVPLTLTSENQTTFTSEEFLDRSNHWTLGCDHKLLNRLKLFSYEIQKESKNVLQQCEHLTEKVENLQGDLELVSNEFLLLSNDKFYENRVEEFEETNQNFNVISKTKNSSTKLTKAEQEEKLIKQLKDSIQKGIQSKNKQQHWRERPNSSNSVFNYERGIRISHVIGTSKYFSSRSGGLINENNLRKELIQETDSIEDIEPNIPTKVSDSSRDSHGAGKVDTKEFQSSDYPFPPRELYKPPTKNERGGSISPTICSTGSSDEFLQIPKAHASSSTATSLTSNASSFKIPNVTSSKSNNIETVDSEDEDFKPLPLGKNIFEDEEDFHVKNFLDDDGSENEDLFGGLSQTRSMKTTNPATMQNIFGQYNNHTPNIFSNEPPPISPVFPPKTQHSQETKNQASSSSSTENLAHIFPSSKTKNLVSKPDGTQPSLNPEESPRLKKTEELSGTNKSVETDGSLETESAIVHHENIEKYHKEEDSSRPKSFVKSMAAGLHINTAALNPGAKHPLFQGRNASVQSPSNTPTSPLFPPGPNTDENLQDDEDISSFKSKGIPAHHHPEEGKPENRTRKSKEEIGTGEVSIRKNFGTEDAQLRKNEGSLQNTRDTIVTNIDNKPVAKVDESREKKLANFKQKSIFDDSSDEDDLFSGKLKSTKPTSEYFPNRKSKMPSFESISSNTSIVSPKSSETVKIADNSKKHAAKLQQRSIFSSDSSDDEGSDLFLPKRKLGEPSMSFLNTSTKNFSSSLFDDEDDDVDIFKPSKKISNSSNFLTKNQNETGSTGSKKVFLDEEKMNSSPMLHETTKKDGDEKNMIQKEEQKPKIETNIANDPLAVVKTSYETVHQEKLASPVLAINSDECSIVKEASKVTSIDSESQKFIQPKIPAKKSEEKLASKYQKEKSIFDEDSDSDDLFSPVSAPKVEPRNKLKETKNISAASIFDSIEDEDDDLFRQNPSKTSNESELANSKKLKKDSASTEDGSLTESHKNLLEKKGNVKMLAQSLNIDPSKFLPRSNLRSSSSSTPSVTPITTPTETSSKVLQSNISFPIESNLHEACSEKPEKVSSDPWENQFRPILASNIIKDRPKIQSHKRKPPSRGIQEAKVDEPGKISIGGISTVEEGNVPLESPLKDNFLKVTIEESHSFYPASLVSPPPISPPLPSENGPLEQSTSESEKRFLLDDDEDDI